MRIRPLLSTLHLLLWLAGVLAVLALIALCVAAYGLPGAWLQSAFDAAIPADVGRLTVRRVAFRLDRGLIVNHLAFTAPDGRLLAGFRRGIFGLRLAGGGNALERLTSADIDALFVAQIPESAPGDEVAGPGGGEPFPDLSHVNVPQLTGVRLTLTDADIIEIRAKSLTGILDAGEGSLRFRSLHANVSEDGKQHAEGEVTIDIHDAKAVATIRGFLIPSRLDGLWRAINCPIIKEYCDFFALTEPAWGDCAFTVGFDLDRDLLDLRLDLLSAEGGAYRGIPFDEAQTTIRCKSIWNTVAEINPIQVRRKGKLVATAAINLDYPADRLSFRAEATGLFPAECFGLIGEDFAEALPAIVTERPPFVTIAGHIPLSGDETLPSQVTLRGFVRAQGGGTVEGLPFDAAEGRFSMTNGVFSLTRLDVRLPHGGSLAGAASFDVPDVGAHTDLSAAIHLRDASLADLLAPFGLNTLTNSVASGFVDLRGRTGTDFAKSLQAEYALTVDGGLITRLPLFAGLTDLLADRLPGIASITDSSHARLTGTADAGRFTIPDFALDGDLLAIEGPATYDLPANTLSAEVIAGNFKRDTVMGTLTRWATVPVNRFLWRVKVSGPLEKPSWKITTFLGRLWDRATGTPSDD